MAYSDTKITFMTENKRWKSIKAQMCLDSRVCCTPTWSWRFLGLITSGKNSLVDELRLFVEMIHADVLFYR